jgi:hypothetical protein
VRSATAPYLTSYFDTSLLPTMSTPAQIESAAVQSYLTSLQSVISRMATNSANCKTLCVTLVSAILVIIADKGKLNFTWIALIPIVLLGLLDAYYLGLEQGFRNTYNQFVKRLQQGVATVNELYTIVPQSEMKKGRSPEGETPYKLQPFNPVRATLNAFTSFSIYPFYVTLIALLILGKQFVFAN